jgi:hypothetical protein
MSVPQGSEKNLSTTIIPLATAKFGCPSRIDLVTDKNGETTTSEAAAYYYPHPTSNPPPKGE